MSEARDAVLASIRAALADRPDAPPESEPALADVALGADREALIGLLAERVADYRATVHIVADDDALRAQIRMICELHGVAALAVAPGVPGALVPEGLDVYQPAAGAEADIAALDHVDGVLTTCAMAIAETGTLVLDAGPGQGPRALSLVPDLHLCVVAADAIVAGVAQAVDQIGEVVKASGRAITLISGPSATSDIELDRVEGVHGPRRLEVIIAR